jgi:hypothetical protein
MLFAALGRCDQQGMGRRATGAIPEKAFRLRQTGYGISAGVIRLGGRKALFSSQLPLLLNKYITDNVPKSPKKSVDEKKRAVA